MSDASADRPPPAPPPGAPMTPAPPPGALITSAPPAGAPMAFAPPAASAAALSAASAVAPAIASAGAPPIESAGAPRPAVASTQFSNESSRARSSSPRISSGASMRRRTIAVVAVLAVASYAMSVAAARTKSATLDEPLHLVAALMRVFHSDYRVDPEDPPLWYWLATAIVPRDAVVIDRTMPLEPGEPMKFVDRVMDPSGGGGLAVLDRARDAMAVLLPATVILGAWCAWNLAARSTAPSAAQSPKSESAESESTASQSSKSQSPALPSTASQSAASHSPASRSSARSGQSIAAMAAAVLLAFDPLLLGHGPLVKNDVAISFLTLAMLASLVVVMRRATVARIALFAACCAAVVTTKFTGMILVPLAFAAILAHALIAGRTRRAWLAAAGAIAAASLVSWGAIWAVYGFRFAPTPEGRPLLDQDWFQTDYAFRDLLGRNARPPTEAEQSAWRPDATVRLVRFASQRRLLPQSFLIGLMFTRGSSLARHTYLAGELSGSGRWWYFPAAMLFKLPTATIVAIVAAIGLLIAGWRRTLARDGLARAEIIGPAIVAGGYFVFAMMSNMNIGIRHVMPVIVVAYVAVAAVLGRCASAKPRAARAVAWVLAIGLIIESVASWPNYIAFFNLPSGGSRGGIRLLGDSNLDWGQDLPLLADWQAKHRGARLYLCYFGGVAPEWYGIDYMNLPGGHWTRPRRWPTSPGVIAVSATRLQCLYMPGELAAYYYDLRINHHPREVLGGTIYLYDFPLK